MSDPGGGHSSFPAGVASECDDRVGRQNQYSGSKYCEVKNCSIRLLIKIIVIYTFLFYQITYVWLVMCLVFSVLLFLL